MFLQLRSIIYIFTDSLFFSFVFIEPFSNFFPRLIADGFAFSFGQHESVGRSLTFRVSAYR